MADVYLGVATRDVARLRPIMNRLQALRVKIVTPLSSETAASELSQTRAVIIVWTKRSVADPEVERAAAFAYRNRTIIALRMENCTPPAAFLRVPMIEADGMPDDAEHFGWPLLLRQVEALIGRPGLVSYDRTVSLRNSDALRAWADAHPSDPLAADGLRLAAQIEAEAALARARQERADAERAQRRSPQRSIVDFLDRHALAIGGGTVGVLSLLMIGAFFGLQPRPSDGSSAQFEEPLVDPYDPNARWEGDLETADGSPPPDRAAQRAAQRRAARRGQAAQPAGSGENAASEAPALVRPFLAANESKAFAAYPMLGAVLSSARFARERAAEMARVATQMAQRADEGVQGFGVVRLPDGALYRGQVVDGMPTGFGVRTDPGERGGVEFQGAIDGGFGQTTWPGGATYLGGHQKGRPWGVGTLKYPDGRIYEGGFDGARAGFGVLRNADGEVLEAGRWDKDALQRPVSIPTQS